MKKVLCLYRVSTLGQVDPKDDIPMQRRECEDFIARHSDWVYYGERLEKGVSGYKVSASKRDVILEIRAMAERKEFVVLLVFMFDRLGRREDETPFLVQWFIEHGIEVWSTREGQQRLDTRVDKLMNFIRFWQAGGESEKTSIRVKAAHTQMTADGIWRGGRHPFGYQLARKGRIGKRKHELFDLEIDPITGPQVQKVFEMACKEGIGNTRIANYMNEHYPNPDKIWTKTTVLSMLRNPIYTGRMHMNDTLSEPVEELRLISDEDFQFTQYAIKSRIQNRYAWRHESDNAHIPEGQTKTSVYGATLLAGILWCGHCHHKLVGSYCCKQMKTHAYYRPIYRCYNGSTDAKECDGQTIYSAKKIETAVLEIVHDYFYSFQSSVDAIWKEQARRQMRSKAQTRIEEHERNLEKLQKQQKALQKEVLKSLTGESGFDTDMLQNMLADNKAEMEACETALRECRKESENEEARLQYLSMQYQHIRDWAEVFDDASIDEKKMIISRIIERIDVDRNYHLTIHFFVTTEDFELNPDPTNATILESKNCLQIRVG